VNILKAIPKYENEDIVIRIFSFAHFSNTFFFTYATIAYSERCKMVRRLGLYEWLDSRTREINLVPIE
jgi:hypothetical protein